MTPDQPPLPIAGRSPSARHASSTGAVAAAEGRGLLTLRYVQLLKAVGPLSDHEAARQLGHPLNSICSTRNGLGDRVRPSGQFESHHAFAKWTKRTRWEWAG